MAYAQGWDASSPDGALTPAADIDVEFQNLKVAIGERLAEVIPEWADDLEEPKKLAIVYGDLASRPAAPDFPGELYFAIDNATLYIGDATPAWVGIGGLTVPEEGEDTGSATYFVAANKGGDQIIGPLSGWIPLSLYVVATSYGVWYSGGSPTRFTAPVGGTYEITASLSVKGIAVFNMGFRVNGSLMGGSLAQIQSVGGTTASHASIHGVYTLAAGDYVEFVVDNITPIVSLTVMGTYSHIKIVRMT